MNVEDYWKAEVLQVECPVCEAERGEVCADWYGTPPMEYSVPLGNGRYHFEREAALEDAAYQYEYDKANGL